MRQSVASLRSRYRRVPRRPLAGAAPAVAASPALALVPVARRRRAPARSARRGSPRDRSAAQCARERAALAAQDAPARSSGTAVQLDVDSRGTTRAEMWSTRRTRIASARSPSRCRQSAVGMAMREGRTRIIRLWRGTWSESGPSSRGQRRPVDRRRDAGASRRRPRDPRSHRDSPKGAARSSSPTTNPA